MYTCAHPVPESLMKRSERDAHIKTNTEVKGRTWHSQWQSFVWGKFSSAMIQMKDG